MMMEFEWFHSIIFICYYYLFVTYILSFIDRIKFVEYCKCYTCYTRCDGVYSSDRITGSGRKAVGSDLRVKLTQSKCNAEPASGS